MPIPTAVVESDNVRISWNNGGVSSKSFHKDSYIVVRCKLDSDGECSVSYMNIIG